jgi:sugar phosphate isomerase/epimerase
MHASPDCYLLSSGYSKERDRAIKQTLQTIDFAQRLGAPFVVMHLGEVPIGPVTDQLVKMVNDGELLSRDFVQKKLAAVQKREAMAQPYLDRVEDALRRISDYAGQRNVKLGLEGRRGYEEIPSERELPMLLEKLNSPVFGYWHDLGHIQIKENLTFLDHAEWLQSMSSRTFGCHVQDCIWPAKDHQVPFDGDVDLERLVPMMPKECCMVWELSPRKTAVEIRRGLAKWKELFGE